jgi:predicted Zn-dependent protease
MSANSLGISPALSGAHRRDRDALVPRRNLCFLAAMKRAFRVFFLGGITAISLLTITGCATSVTGRKQFIITSAAQETQLGFEAFDQMKKEVPISTNPQYKSLVERVGAKIAEQAKDRMPDAKWEFVVFESKEANAFCLPGGKIGVYTGILPITQNEAGLATVIGHEVAHASNRHGGERLSQAQALQTGTALAGSAVPEKYSQLTMVALGGIGKIGIELPYSRLQESEADHVGLLYMAKAGYDPEEAVRFWERFSAANKGQPQGLELLRTHPVDSKRIANLKALMPEAKAIYQRARTTGAKP